MSLVLDRVLSSEVRLAPRIPSRVVMNNQTISLFMLGGDNYQNVYKSFDLKYVLTEDSKDDPDTCFVLKDSRDPNNKVSTLCATGIDLKPD